MTVATRPATCRVGKEKALLRTSPDLTTAALTTLASAAALVVSAMRPPMKADPVISALGNARDRFLHFLRPSVPKVLGIVASNVRTTVAAIPSERTGGRALPPGAKVDRKDPDPLESSGTGPSALNVLSELLLPPSVTTSGALA